MVQIKKNSDGVTSVRRSLEIIELIADTDSGMTVSQLSETLGVNKGIVFRILRTLEGCGYVFKENVTHAYRLTYKVSNIGMRQLSNVRLLDQCASVLQSLADTTGELVRLAVVEGKSITWVYSTLGKARALQINPNYSLEISLHAHAAGKAWLSTQPLEEAIALVQQAGIKIFTDFTLASIQAIRKDLMLTGERGYAISDQEHDYGVTSIGTPIMTLTKSGNTLCVGIVSLAAPTSRMSREALEGCAPLVKSVAEKLAWIWPSTAIHTHADPLSSASGQLP